MNWSYSIGKLFGSELRVHATFFLLLAWIGMSAWLAEGPNAAIVNVLFVVAVFACVVAHEYGHALVARRFGVRTPDIVLLPIGGMARLERIPEDPKQEIAIALAGPAVNIVIWTSLTLVLGAEASVMSLVELEDTGRGFIERLAAVNFFLAVFNMLPAFPMDGGRVLRSALAIRFDRVRATQIAAAAGQSIAFLLGLLGLVSGNLLLLLVAVFVFLAAIAESSQVTLLGLARGYAARDALITSYERLSPDASMQTAEALLLATTQSEFPVVDGDERLLGVLTKASIVANAKESAGRGSVVDAMLTQVPECKLTAPLQDVLELLQSPENPVVAVTNKHGHFIGYITRENVAEWMLLHEGHRH